MRIVPSHSLGSFDYASTSIIGTVAILQATETVDNRSPPSFHDVDHAGPLEDDEYELCDLLYVS